MNKLWNSEQIWNCEHFLNLWTNYEIANKYETANIFWISEQIFKKMEHFMIFRTKNWNREHFLNWWTKKIKNGIFHEIMNKNLKPRTFFEILEQFLNFWPNFETANIFWNPEHFWNHQHFSIWEIFFKKEHFLELLNIFLNSD